MSRSRAGSAFLLFLTAAIWGLSFVSQSKGMEYMGPLTFNGVRCLIGAAVLAAYLAAARLARPPGRDKTPRGGSLPMNTPRAWLTGRRDKTLRAGVLCGLVLTAASMFQQYGIRYTTVGKAGFLTALYIVFVPVAGLFFGKKPAPPVWAGVAAAAVGMYLLCVTEGLRVGPGDMLVFVCSLFFAAHILVIDHYAPDTDGAAVSCIQFTVCGLLCSAGALAFERPAWGQVAEGAGTLFYAGVLSCGVAYTLQIVGQKGVHPTVAALILSLESVIAAVAGWAAFRTGFLLADQSMTARQAVGCVLVFGAVVTAQMPWGRERARGRRGPADFKKQYKKDRIGKNSG